MAKVTVRFQQSCSPYCSGDEAVFEDKDAAIYVKKGIASYVTAEVSAAPVTKPVIKEEKVPSSSADLKKEEPPKKKKKKRILSKIKKKASE